MLIWIKKHVKHVHIKRSRISVLQCLDEIIQTLNSTDLVCLLHYLDSCIILIAFSILTTRL